ncbi:hypothetical protein PFISCL1PPCAC_21857, partial [Pristionchus fissidentatus]
KTPMAPGIFSSKVEEEKNNKGLFPILELPAELSSNILSFMRRKELQVCLQSFALDNVHAEMNKEERIEFMKIDSLGANAEVGCERYGYFKPYHTTFQHICHRLRYILNKCEFGTLIINIKEGDNVANVREMVELCKGIRCKNLLKIKYDNENSCSKFLTDKSLRELISDKKDVEIAFMCEGITAAGLVTVWKDLLDGRFDGLSIQIGDSLVSELFEMLQIHSKKTVLKVQKNFPIIAGGTMNRYDIWKSEIRDKKGMKTVLHMSRIYDGRRWTPGKYRLAFQPLILQNY